MAYDVTSSFSEEQIKLEGTFVTNLFVINASQSGWDPLYYWNGNQDIYGYQLTSSGTVTGTEESYTGLPINSDAMKSSVTGDIPGISISIPNTNRVIESVIQDNDYLRGREVYAITCFAKHLPSGVTAKHIGSSPDENALIKEKLYIDSTTSNEEAVSFSCKPKFNIKNAVIPRRTFSKECAWNFTGSYLGSNCDPSSSIDSVTYPTCDGTLKQCRERSNENRFGGFPSIPTKGFTIV